MHSSSINVKKAIVIQTQVLSTDNNWRNTEICHGSGSVSHVDARGSLRHISWDKEFIPYALNLNIWFISPGLHKTKHSKLQRIQCIYQAWFLWEPSVLESNWVMSTTYVFTWFSRETYQPLSGLALRGLQSQKPHRVVPNNWSFQIIFVDTLHLWGEPEICLPPLRAGQLTDSLLKKRVGEGKIVTVHWTKSENTTLTQWWRWTSPVAQWYHVGILSFQIWYDKKGTSTLGYSFSKPITKM